MGSYFSTEKKEDSAPTAATEDLIDAKPGKMTAERDMDDDVMELIMKVKEEIEKAADTTFDVFEPRSYATQLVNGTNYFIRINVGDEFIHVRVHKALDGTITLHSVKTGKKEDDDLVYF